MSAEGDSDTPEPIREGDVVQINPEYDQRFGGCLMVVEKVKNWGFTGYCALPGHPEPSYAYYRVEHENCKRVGHAPWTLSE